MDFLFTSADLEVTPQQTPEKLPMVFLFTGPIYFRLPISYRYTPRSTERPPLPIWHLAGGCPADPEETHNCRTTGARSGLRRDRAIARCCNQRAEPLGLFREGNNDSQLPNTQLRTLSGTALAKHMLVKSDFKNGKQVSMSTAQTAQYTAPKTYWSNDGDSNSRSNRRTELASHSHDPFSRGYRFCRLTCTPAVAVGKTGVVLSVLPLRLFHCENPLVARAPAVKRSSSASVKDRRSSVTSSCWLLNARSMMRLKRSPV